MSKIIKKNDLGGSTSEVVYIYPTDTVWGIGASIFSEEANYKIRKLKRMSLDKPMSILFPGIDMLLQYVKVSKINNDLLKKIFSLETTLAIKTSQFIRKIPSWINCDLEYVFVRCLEFDSVKKIINDEGGPITTTSLNISGSKPIIELKDARKFKDSLDIDVLLITDELITPSGLSSTIIKYDADNIAIIRQGDKWKEVKKLEGLFSA